MRKTVYAAVAAVAAIGIGALYGIAGPDSNGAAPACDGALSAARQLDPLAVGEVAAFKVAARAEHLGGLAFRGDQDEAKTLADFAGRTVLVNLWATWCAPCRAEMPALDRLQAAEGDDGFAVVPISIDIGSRDKPRAFLESVNAANLPLFTDSSTAIFNEVKQRSLALGLPVTLLLDEQGCLLGHMNGPAEWDSEDALELVRAAKNGGRSSRT
ncbi:thiol:disulfide interchange protein TlpA [Faunimonas sp. B44]|uniref:thiol:disulfide interchange protein TlpA n=1 Tax=Faunimonas sp. B44 TaxID=3461493 RepID=UPI0040444600